MILISCLQMSEFTGHSLKYHIAQNLYWFIALPVKSLSGAVYLGKSVPISRRPRAVEEQGQYHWVSAMQISDRRREDALKKL